VYNRKHVVGIWGIAPTMRGLLCVWFFDRQHTFLGTNSRLAIPLSWGWSAITFHINQVHICAHEHYSVAQQLHFVFLHCYLQRYPVLSNYLT
jgi:hypothetical protein